MIFNHAISKLNFKTTMLLLQGIFHMVYSLTFFYISQDKPNFVDPSVPPNSELVCKVNESCHLYMNATPGGQYLSMEWYVYVFISFCLPKM